MSTDKPKLTAKSKRALLEQALQWVQLRMSQNKVDGNEPIFFSFIKFMVINKSFLDVSHDASFDIYELILDFSWESNSLCFKSKHFGASRMIEMSFERDYKLAKILQPSKIGLDFNNKIEEEDFSELVKILKATNGEISIQNMCTNNQIQALGEMFASRIHKFSCIGRFFKYSDILSFGFLDELDVDVIQNTGQFLQISKCKTKSLKLRFLEYEFENSHSFDDLPKKMFNKKVKNLNLSVYGFNQDMTQLIIDKVLAFFPSLVELKIDVDSSYNNYPQNQISNIAFNSHQYMYVLKDRLLAKGLKKIAFRASYWFYYGDKCGPQWIGNTFRAADFSTWKYALWDQPSYDYGDTFRDVIFEFSTEEGSNCKFDIKLEVTHLIGALDVNEVI